MSGIALEKIEINEKRPAFCVGRPWSLLPALVLQAVNIELALGRTCAYGIMRRGDEHLAVGHAGVGDLDAETGNVGGILRTGVEQARNSASALKSGTNSTLNEISVKKDE
jgi:hypothetical protein